MTYMIDTNGDVVAMEDNQMHAPVVKETMQAARHITFNHTKASINESWRMTKSIAQTTALASLETTCVASKGVAQTAKFVYKHTDNWANKLAERICKRAR